MKCCYKLSPLLLAMIFMPVKADEHEELLIIEEESEEVLLIEDMNEELVLEDEGDISGDELILEDEATEEPEQLVIDESPSDLEEAETSVAALDTHAPSGTDSGWSARLDNLWAEYGHFTNSDSLADNQAYIHGKASLEWTNGSNWELKISGRFDGYQESGENDWDKLTGDYDETYIRYKTDKSIITLGAQKILWGRIDEFPPTDRLSTQDFRRFVTDDLKDRRLASLALRLEHFIGDSKIDLMVLPDFRKAKLPNKDSVWHPISKHRGEILGLETTPALEALIQNTPIKNKAPDSEGGAGIRFSSIGSGFDYGISVQHGRQTIPYFSYNPDKNLIEARYPRTWIAGIDFGVEALGGTLKFEGTWLEDNPVTKNDGSFDTVAAVNWGLAWEVFPGDGDARLNLQVTGLQLASASDVLDRSEVYTFNGSYEVPFADESWRLKTRFYAGLNDSDYYLNPELAYTGWDAQEVYLELHYFDGDPGTPGGFHEDNTLLTLGWRGEF